MVDKVRAIELRKSGKTYKEIAEILGCSIDWCKRSLSGVECVKVKEATFIDDLISKAKSDDALTSYQIKGAIMQNGVFPDTKEGREALTNETKKVRRKINAEDDTIIRPSWMRPESAILSWQQILESTNTINDRITEEIELVRQKLNLGREHSKSIGYSIVSLTQVGEPLLHTSAAVECARYELIAQRLDDRNGSQPIEEGEYTVSFQCSEAAQLDEYADNREKLPIWLIEQ
jgi:hypothetical protein